MIGFFVGLYVAIFAGIERLTNGWFVGLAARLIFAATLFPFFWNSALTKIGGDYANIFSPTVGAYAQILPGLMESVGYDRSEVAFLPYGLIVLVGTLSEFILPILVVIGLCTRAASLGMIVFIAVMTYVDITGHGVDAPTIGALFDGNPYSAIFDTRLMWLFLLLVPMLKGPGVISVDAFLGLQYRRRQMYY